MYEPRQKYIRMIVVLCLVLFLTTSNIVADIELQEIEVLSETSQDERRKNSEEMFLKPYSKHVVGEQTILEENIPNIAEAIRDVPGVTVTETGAFGRNIRVRGLDGPRVITLVNGIRISSQGLSTSGAGQQGSQEIANVKKIEVIKGSPAVIFDPGASGGAINIITHQAPVEKDMSFEQRINYDEGLGLKKSTSIIEGSTGTIGARVSFTKAVADDYKMSGDEEDTTLLVDDVNFINEDSSSVIRIADLGFNTENLTVDLNAKIGEDGLLSLTWDDWVGKNMTFIVGATIEDATVFQFDRMTRDTKGITYKKESLGDFRDIQINYTQMHQNQLASLQGMGNTLNSKQLNVVSDYYFDKLIIKFGGELRLDDAITRVYAEQEYYGVFVNSEYYINDEWILFAGMRLNKWETSQRLLEGTNEVVAGQLVGISGSTPPQTLSSPTAAIGARYAVNDENSVSVNLNTTYRSPNLMERYSFAGIIGGGIDLKPESGNHAEITWKHLDDNLAITSSAFYSDFENFIWRKQVSQLINQGALLECIRLGNCNPAIGDYDERESDFFDTYTKYYNSEKVKNWGLEFNLEYSIEQHEFLFFSSFNKIISEDIYVQAAGMPIDTGITYRYEINNSWRPWFKVRAQYVMDFPKVLQHSGFEPFFLANLHAGFIKDNFIFSAGVRNVFDTVYHVPYSGINGLARTVFANVAYKWE